MTATVSSETYPEGLPRLDNAGWRARYEGLYPPNFGVRRLALVRGRGTRVWDAEGREYLDFLTGISVNNLGHCHPRVTRAIQQQAQTLVHCTNLYYIPVQIELARLLVEHSFADRVFFGNSGAEANEAAIKIVRRYMKETRGPGHHEIVCMLNSFHGRTLATLTATGQDKVKLHFEPLPEGFVHVPFNDLAALEAAVGERTGAIMIEPVQGESGIIPAEKEFIQGVRRLCDERGILLVFDEIQTGLGRTGTLFAYEQFGVQPDIMTLAKSLGGGLAMGAMLCRDPVAQALGPGSHGTTMGGNPLTAAAALAYVSELIEGDWPRKGAEAGEYFRARLAETIGAHANVKEIRGMGLMMAVELREGAADALLACERAGLLINHTGGQTLRILPPLNVSRGEIDQAAAILTRVIGKGA
jgi:predicted acetylornithine/succinylornithine family transaminase